MTYGRRLVVWGKVGQDRRLLPAHSGQLHTGHLCSCQCSRAHLWARTQHTPHPAHTQTVCTGFYLQDYKIIYMFLMRDEKEERKKQARSNKQTRQSNTARTSHRDEEGRKREADEGRRKREARLVW